MRPSDELGSLGCRNSAVARETISYVRPAEARTSKNLTTCSNGTSTKTHQMTPSVNICKIRTTRVGIDQQQQTSQHLSQSSSLMTHHHMSHQNTRQSSINIHRLQLCANRHQTSHENMRRTRSIAILLSSRRRVYSISNHHAVWH